MKKTHQQQLKDIVFRKGGGAIVARELQTDKLTCSQQSVSAWINGEWLPQGPMQERIQKLYGISMPWAPLPVVEKKKGKRSTAGAS